jgi:hypothetical protein
MAPDRLALALRRRSPWEAMDLGFAMTRQWARPVWGAWCAVYLPAALALHLAFYERPWLAMLVLWWAKPFFDRVVLYVLGAAVFGEPPSVRQTLAALPQCLSPGLLAGLTFYRFDLARSFNLPVWQLERLAGAPARARARVLHPRARGHAVMLTVLCANLEVVALLALAGLVSFLAPGPFDLEAGWSLLFPDSSSAKGWQEWANAAIYVIAVSVIEPIYVAAGFALYLNRRTQLEAWDVELALRRVSMKAAAARAAVVAAVIAVLACAGFPGDANAQAAAPREAIREVLKDKAFDQTRETREWRYTGRGLGRDVVEEKKDARGGMGLWENFGIFMAELMRAALWIAAGGALLWLAVQIARRFGGWEGFGRAGRKPPAIVFGLDIRPESLPDDVAGVAAELARAGRLREALSLLYRGAISALVHGGGLEIEPGVTEEECARRVARLAAQERSRYFAELVLAWQTVAYGQRAVGRERAVALCEAWRSHFSGARQ